MATKKEQFSQAVSNKVGAGKFVNLETVDFNDPNRPKTCLEVDFPILALNEIAQPETSSGAARKPIYTATKWWARRPSSVFRGLILAAAAKAPDNPSYAAKLVWDNFYSNHQKNDEFKKLKVLDIFMGGGTTLVEGSRFGMQMIGNDLNPVAWFVVKQALTKVDLNEAKQFLQAIEEEVKPQIMPYFYCDGPDGERGVWTNKNINKVMPHDFDPLSIPEDQRKNYKYEGPEIIYTFWAKNGPCQVTGCGHRTPIMSSPVMAIKSLSVKFWHHECSKCKTSFDIEEDSVRMAPDVPLVIADTELPYSVLDNKKGAICPSCGHATLLNLGKGKNKKIQLSLLVHPDWLAGSPKQDLNGDLYGGSAQDSTLATEKWHVDRASKIRLLEVRGALPDIVVCPVTLKHIDTTIGTVPKKATFTCGACGTGQSILETVKTSGKTAPISGYAIHGYSPNRSNFGKPYNGRFFSPMDEKLTSQYCRADEEWSRRSKSDLADYWPSSEIPYGFMTSLNNGGLANHGFTHWWSMFNSRQLLVHSQILKSIINLPGFSQDAREFMLGAFQQALRANCMFSFWNTAQDCLEPFLGSSNFHSKSNVVENTVFNSEIGRGSYRVYADRMIEALEFAKNPWDLVLRERFAIKEGLGKTEKINIGDPVLPRDCKIICSSSTELVDIDSSSIDLVITDPPFGGLLHYSELSDFFYVWLRLGLKKYFPEYFSAEFTPKTLEAVANRAREPHDSDAFYQRVLTQCWKEANRVLKPGGILTFTFHHSEDEPWVAVLESLFDAGFYLEATYPIRSDETKGDGGKPGTFGSQTIEYDIIHVCRKRTEEQKPVSWGRMRREVMSDVRHLQGMLENHAKEGLPAADIQVIRRGKALEYFSRHYGKVFVDEGQPISVRDALIGINQLIDEDADKGKEAPPVNLEPMSRQFLRTFDGKPEIPRDQLQKFLKGSITTPDEFVQRGWCTEKNKVFTLVDPLDFARDWQGKHKRKLTSDLDQAFVLIGACIDGSGINAADTLKNDNFKPHAALKPLIDWMSRHAATSHSRNAAIRAISIYNNWAAQNQKQVQQMALFFDEA
jgi:putative DNA methylase